MPSSNLHHQSLPERLPVEILKLISEDYLTFASLAALSLTSREMLRKLGTQYITALKIENEPKIAQGVETDETSIVVRRPDPFAELRLQRQKFLLLLQRDLDGHIYCFSCKQLHRAFRPSSSAEVFFVRGRFDERYKRRRICARPRLPADMWND